MPKGERLDLLVVARGLIDTREAARTAIIDGIVLVNGKKLTKPGTSVPKEAIIELIPSFQHMKYVSRGGLKLEKAINVFGISLDKRICLDIGASTGGFTDCLLQHGAQLIYAIDVGYGQLAWSLRNNSKVIVKERVNARYLEPAILYQEGYQFADFACLDVSFISLGKVLPACIKVLVPSNYDIVCLVKPQFEAGRQLVGKGGVVSSKTTHKSVLSSIFLNCEQIGLYCHALTYSPMKGPAGNIEYLIHLRPTALSGYLDIETVVEEAHTVLNSKL